MKILKNQLFVFGCTILISSMSIAQQIEYIYDNAGNRVLRQIYVMKSSSNDDSQLKNENILAQSLSDTTGKYDFKLYPNPTRDFLQIETCELFLELPSKSVLVYDLTGKLLINQQIDERTTQLDFSNFITGNYIVRMLSDGKQIREWKVVRE